MKLTLEMRFVPSMRRIFRSGLQASAKANARGPLSSCRISALVPL